MLDFVAAVTLKSFLVFGDSVFTVAERGFSSGDDHVLHVGIMELLQNFCSFIMEIFRREYKVW